MSSKSDEVIRYTRQAFDSTLFENQSHSMVAGFLLSLEYMLATARCFAAGDPLLANLRLDAKDAIFWRLNLRSGQVQGRFSQFAEDVADHLLDPSVRKEFMREVERTVEGWGGTLYRTMPVSSPAG
jgi:hypothetical protein